MNVKRTGDLFDDDHDVVVPLHDAVPRHRPLPIRHRIQLSPHFVYYFKRPICKALDEYEVRKFDQLGEPAGMVLAGGHDDPGAMPKLAGLVGTAIQFRSNEKCQFLPGIDSTIWKPLR